MGVRCIRTVLVISCGVFTLLLTSCTARTALDERRLSALNPTATQIESHEITVQRAELKKALFDTARVERLRVIEVFASPIARGSYPEYRLFEIEPGSVYQLLGLQNADILVGVNDYIVANPGVFKKFVYLLPQEKEAQIEVRRGNQPMLFHYKVID